MSNRTKDRLHVVSDEIHQSDQMEVITAEVLSSTSLGQMPASRQSIDGLMAFDPHDLAFYSDSDRLLIVAAIARTQKHFGSAEDGSALNGEFDTASRVCDEARRLVTEEGWSSDASSPMSLMVRILVESSHLDVSVLEEIDRLLSDADPTDPLKNALSAITRAFTLTFREAPSRRSCTPRTASTSRRCRHWPDVSCRVFTPRDRAAAGTPWSQYSQSGKGYRCHQESAPRNSRSAPSRVRSYPPHRS